MARQEYTDKEIAEIKARLYGKWRIYKPLWLDENNLKRDLDREFESISQALIAVTERLDTLEKKLDEYISKHP